MDVVYLLWHSYELDGDEETKLLGVYSTRERAERRQAEAGTLPGFRDHPDDFVIDAYRVDHDEWTEGFVTVSGEKPSPTTGS